MFKKLDKLIIKAFIGPFVATFFITLFVLVMQFFWLYIDDFVGKGISPAILLEFIGYKSMALVPLALPLAILLSSLMTFGNLGESFELVAIKSSGISLLRFMRPLFFVTLGVCFIAFSFANYIIPVANLKSETMLRDVVFTKPAFDLKEGVFYDKLNGFAIKIGKKEANDSVIRDVVVYEQGNALQDNFIIANSGIMKVTPDKRFLEFNLKDGWRYQERGDVSMGDKTDYIRIHFKEYKKFFDLSSFLFTQSADSLYKSNERMYSMRQLNKVIDSIKKDNDAIVERQKKEILISFPFAKYLDSSWDKVSDSSLKKADNFNKIIPDSARRMLDDRAIAQVNSLRVSSEVTANDLKERDKNLNRHKIEWHRKIVYSLACLVLFLIGAPLGSIIRKGGLGMPLVFAIIFFMVFYFSTTTGEKFARENTWSAFSGMWLAIFVLAPIGIFLTYKAMKDSQLFNKEFYHRTTKFFRGVLGKKKNSENS